MAQSGRARQRPQFPAWWRETCLHSASSAPALPDTGPRRGRARERERERERERGDTFISQKDGRMSRILTIGAANSGPIQRSGDRASVVQRVLDLMRQAWQRLILRD